MPRGLYTDEAAGAARDGKDVYNRSVSRVGGVVVGSKNGLRLHENFVEPKVLAGLPVNCVMQNSGHPLTELLSGKPLSVQPLNVMHVLRKALRALRCDGDQ